MSHSRTLALGFVFVAGLFMASSPPAVAQETVINCPLRQFVQTTPERLPRGWTNFAKISRLTGTAVVEDQSGRFLECRYGDAGTIRQKLTRRLSACQPTANGFVCAGRRAPTRNTAAQGQFRLNIGESINLDNGQKRRRVREADILLFLTNNRRPLLRAENGAAFSRRSVNSISECFRRRFDHYQIRPANRRGDNICYKTNRGRIGVLTVEDADSSGFVAQFTTLERNSGR